MSTPTTDDEFSSLKCRYASKRCWNLRAIKRNGERHNLCEMHRQKANSNQRRLDKKRKAGQTLIGLPHHLPMQSGFDLERRMRLRLKREQELGAVPLTTQYIRHPRATPSLMELERAAGLVAMGNAHPYSSDWETRLPSSMYAAYPRSPQAMLRVAALVKMEPSMERGWMPLSPPRIDAAPLLPPIATAVARSGEGLASSWQPDVRRASLVNRANI